MKRSWCNLFQNVYRRSLRPVPTDENRSFQLPRPARTPPSTFLFLHLHLSNSLGPKPRPTLNGAFEDPLDDKWQPMETGCSFTHHNEELHEARKLAVAEGQGSAALSGRVIVPPHSACQRSIVNKSSHRAFFCAAKEAVVSPCFPGKLVPYLSHNPATF
jgi:hypothetical protein